MDAEVLCMLIMVAVPSLIWLYLFGMSTLGALRALGFKGEDAPRQDAWIAFGMAYSGLFVGTLPVLMVAVMRGRVWPRVNYDDDTVGTVMLDDTTSRLISTQLFIMVLGIVFAGLIFAMIFASSIR